jgi:hypothetical protein
VFAFVLIELSEFCINPFFVDLTARVSKSYSWCIDFSAITIRSRSDGNDEGPIGGTKGRKCTAISKVL